jgi:hypothetical protein
LERSPESSPAGRATRTSRCATSRRLGPYRGSPRSNRATNSKRAWPSGGPSKKTLHKRSD